MNPPPFIIEEIEGAGGRMVILREDALPAPPYALPTTHEIAVTRSLGSPYNTHQTMGANHPATTISGEWHTYKLSGSNISVSAATDVVIDGQAMVSIDNTDIHTSFEIAALIDDIVERGRLCRVTWGPHIRYGRLSNFTPKWITIEDCEWEITFEWTGKDEQTQAGPPANIDPSADVRALNENTNKLIASTDFPLPDIDPSPLQAVDNRIARIQSGISDLSETIQTRIDGIATAADVFRRVSGLMTYVADEANLIALEIDSRVSGSWIVNADPEDLGDISPSKMLTMMLNLRVSSQASRHLAHEAILRRQAVMASVDGVDIIVIAREGEDLLDIAKSVWGTTDSWTDIRDFNGFSSSILSTGTVVLIPRRGTRTA